jgi:uncharacterized repeat protein (TIGR03803 family)
MRRWKAECLLTLCLLVAVTPNTWAQQFSVLYDFGAGGDQDPIQPSYPGIIAQGQDGNLYSTAPNTPNGDAGALFAVTPAGNLNVLYDLTSYSLGATPYSGLTLGTDGNFYGTASTGGSHDDGAVLQITPYNLNPLWFFTGNSDEGQPYAPPIQGFDGSFYGTTAGTNSGFGQTYGTIYRFSAPESSMMAVLYTFDKQHGAVPYAPLVQGTDGNFYGVTSAGGDLNLGIIFSITPEAKFQVLYNFDGVHGAQPYGPLMEGSDGNFYGTTFAGGSHNSGVIFRITPGGAFKVLHAFSGSTGGYYPAGGLVQGDDGNFYGTTRSGGSADAGTIFRMTPQGKYAVLHEFHVYDGKYPLVTLTQHTNGIFYGDTQQGGATSNYCHQNCGVFYSLDMGLSPFVSLVPAAAKREATIGILGQGLHGTTSVTFNGRPAQFNVVSDTFITATVPLRVKNGFVRVSTPGGTLKSNREFLVIK